ncbi:hypothetical protein NW762_003781 [Fusarium torreyae]|uniref:Uncharacterized protein n=1 Tax=Fusarium torreyae TaxID=1237075 RepID=A0A9W8VJF0_9HYPO|nr:hypothetical protein NW762_003781 [Fusarium torreyae]
MAPPKLPSKLLTCLPPWCEGADDEANSPESQPAPIPFCLTVPHSVLRKTTLWDELGNTDDLNNRGLKIRIENVCREIEHYQQHDDRELHGLSRTIIIKYGETAIRVMRRAWDLYLVHNSSPEIPGGDPGVFDQSTWLSTIRDTVLYRMHYAEDFKIANHNQISKGVYITDVLTQDHRDRVKRAELERKVFTSMLEELTQEPLDYLPGYKATALGEAPVAALRRCVETVNQFYEISDEKENILENDDEDDMRYYQALQLWHIAARAAMSWEPRRVGTLQGVLAMYCDDILRRRKIEKSKRNAELRQSLQAILGDTRGDQIGMGSVADESEEEESEDTSEESPDEDGDDEEDGSEEDSEDGEDEEDDIYGVSDGDSDESSEDEDDSDDEGRPYFEQHAN